MMPLHLRPHTQGTRVVSISLAVELARCHGLHMLCLSACNAIRSVGSHPTVTASEGWELNDHRLDGLTGAECPADEGCDAW